MLEGQRILPAQPLETEASPEVALEATPIPVPMRRVRDDGADGARSGGRVILEKRPLLRLTVHVRLAAKLL